MCREPDNLRESNLSVKHGIGRVTSRQFVLSGTIPGENNNLGQRGYGHLRKRSTLIRHSIRWHFAVYGVIRQESDLSCESQTPALLKSRGLNSQPSVRLFIESEYTFGSFGFTRRTIKQTKKKREKNACRDDLGPERVLTCLKTRTEAKNTPRFCTKICKSTAINK